MRKLKDKDYVKHTYTNKISEPNGFYAIHELHNLDEGEYKVYVENLNAAWEGKNLLAFNRTKELIDSVVIEDAKVHFKTKR